MADYIKATVKDISEETEQTRREMARDRNTDSRTLRMLAEDEDIVVRTLVSANPNTPEDVIDSLVGETMPEYCIDVCSVYDNWEWDFKYYKDNVHDYLESHAVILSSDYDTADTDWWNETSSYTDEVWEFLQAAENVEDFKAKLVEEGYDYYNDEVYEGLYELYENMGEPEYCDEDFISEAIEIVCPDADITQERIYGPSSRNQKSAWVIYDDEIDIDKLRDWLFGDVYELRLYRLDLAAVPMDRDVDYYEMYYDYGDNTDNDLISNAEMQELYSQGIYSAVPAHYGLSEDECEVIGDI